MMTTEKHISYRDMIYRGTCQHCNRTYEVEFEDISCPHLVPVFYPDAALCFALCDCNEGEPEARHFCYFVLIGTPKGCKVRWGGLERAVSTIGNGLTTLQTLLRSNNQ